ncbi:MAG: acyl-CoA reductase [Crocinitomicaceae bacterium]|nr:acyl-CoA reductase [Crocinitomicaceae bacterium]
MKQKEIVSGFAQLGKLMRALGNNEEWADFTVGVTESEYESLIGIINRQFSYNGWFTKENVRKALLNLGDQLTEENLTNWTSNYSFSENQKRIGIIMAGNIPLVGFHDFLCTLCSGNKAVCKLSSNDKTLLPALAAHLIEFCPSLKERIEFSGGKIGEMDGVIATGSDNSIKYFEQYFGKYPHIFRKNRTSVAVLDGTESKEDLNRLGEDIFSYFGLGCRNVSHLFVPQDFELSHFFEAIVPYGDIIHNNKYGNNYDYHRAVYLMNQIPLLDNNFVLLRESEDLFSPLAIIHFERYQDMNSVKEKLSDNEENIQVIVGNGFESFGSSQIPTLSDYADGVDVMKWLGSIS